MTSRLITTAPPARRAAKRLAAVFAMAALLSSGGGNDARAQHAEGRPVRGVLELFTSQGCSSCPQADAILSGYAAGPDVLALSYHVDYWDYIGWKDALASRQNTERQKAYGKAFGHRTVYTPQLVVNGEREVAGAKPADVAMAIDAEDLRAQGGAGAIALSQEGASVSIRAEAPAAANAGEIVLVLVSYRRETQTQVSRGENEGRTLVNHHSVRDWRVVGKVTGRSMEIDMPVSMLADPDGAPTGCAVFLQEVSAKGVPGPIRAAAMLDLAP